MLTLLKLNSPAQVSAEEYLEPLADSEIVIDANLSEWRATRHSAEYLIRGLVASPSDLSGAFYLAFNARWLYIGLEGRDDALVRGRGDQIQIHIADARGKRATTLNLNVGDLKSSLYSFKRKSKRGRSKRRSKLKLRRGRRVVRDVTMKSAFTPKGQGGTYTIEARLPIRTIPWLLGSSARITALFIDRDPNREESIYATHFSSGSGVADEVTFTLGGALLFKQLYRQDRADPVIAERYRDWIGDGRDELLMVTSSEIVLFGYQVNRELRHARAVHGFTLTKRDRVNIEGTKPNLRAVIEHQNPKTRERHKVTYELIKGKLKRVPNVVIPSPTEPSPATPGSTTPGSSTPNSTAPNSAASSSAARRPMAPNR